MEEISQPELIAPRRMILANVSVGILKRPHKIVIYGVEGVGKTTLGSDAPSPVFIGAEDGSGHIAGIGRFPQPTTWEEVLEAIDTLQDGDHQFRTVVLDSLDWMEPLVWSAVCRRYHVQSIEQVLGGFGKGYVAALDEWRALLAKLERLRITRNMEIVLIAHSTVKVAKQPDTEDFERYQLAINAKAAELIKQWADMVLFARYETFTKEQNKRAKGDGSGARVMHTQWRPAFDAKNRLCLPQKLALNYEALATAIRDGVDGEEQRGKITRLLERVDDPTFSEKARASLGSVGNDRVKLAKLLDLVMNKINEGSEQ